MPPSAPGLLPACNNMRLYICIGCLVVGHVSHLSYMRSEPDVYNQVQTGMATQAIVPLAGWQRNARIPKSNRMPDALHSVKVETQVVNSIEDLRQDFVRGINVAEIRARIAPAHSA